MINLSTGFVNALASRMGLQEILDNMVIEIRSGSQNATTAITNGADMADTGTLLWKASVNSQAITEETLATATIDLTGASANPTAFTIGGHTPIKLSALPTFTTAAQLATDVAAAINASTFALGFTAAVVSTDSLVLTAPKNSGAYVNTTPAVFTAAGLGGGAISTTFTGGVTAVNKLSAPAPSGGTITYDPATQVWSGTGLVAGVPQHFRIKCSSGDTGAASTAFRRIDGSIAQIGGDMKVSTAEVVVGKLQTIDEFSMTIPQ